MKRGDLAQIHSKSRPCAQSHRATLANQLPGDAVALNHAEVEIADLRTQLLSHQNNAAHQQNMLQIEADRDRYRDARPQLVPAPLPRESDCAPLTISR